MHAQNEFLLSDGAFNQAAHSCLILHGIEHKHWVW